MGAELSQSLKFWYRQKYNLPPNDPRFLSISEKEIYVEYEAYLAFAGGKLKACFSCGVKTHANECHTCTDSEGNPLPITGDKVVDSIIARAESGENIDFNELLKIEKFETVIPGEDDVGD